MKYFEKLKTSQLLLLSVFLIAAIAASIILNLPYQVSLTTETAQMNITAETKVNLPCSEVQLKAGSTTMVEADVTGKGYAVVSLLDEDNQLKLHIIGLLRGLDCTMAVTLKRGESIQLPATMTFIARDGVYPVPAPAGAFRTFKY